jgi:hypothetical protein
VPATPPAREHHLRDRPSRWAASPR